MSRIQTLVHILTKCSTESRIRIHGKPPIFGVLEGMTQNTDTLFRLTSWWLCQ